MLKKISHKILNYSRQWKPRRRSFQQDQLKPNILSNSISTAVFWEKAVREPAALGQLLGISARLDTQSSNAAVFLENRKGTLRQRKQRSSLFLSLSLSFPLIIYLKMQHVYIITSPYNNGIIELEVEPAAQARDRILFEKNSCPISSEKPPGMEHWQLIANCFNAEKRDFVYFRRKTKNPRIQQNYPLAMF